ncbi:MAG: hypothetical protein ACYCSG_02815 [Thermoplasmataceae archaeon]
MSYQRSMFEDRRKKYSDWKMERSISRSPGRVGPQYSPNRAIGYCIILSMMLWWIPIIGPATAGYLSGRKSGSTTDALKASMITSAVIILLSMYLISFAAAGPSLFGNYLRQGIFAFSNSPLAGATNLVFYTQSVFGLIEMFAIILPSSLIIMNFFSYAGGFQSSLIKNERGYSPIYDLPSSRMRDQEMFRMESDRRSIPTFEDLEYERAPLIGQGGGSRYRSGSRPRNDSRYDDGDYDNRDQGWSYIE